MSNDGNTDIQNAHSLPTTASLMHLLTCISENLRGTRGSKSKEVIQGGKRGDAAFTGFGTMRTNDRGGTVFKAPTLAAKTTNHAPDADIFGPVNDAKDKACPVDEGTGNILSNSLSSRRSVALKRHIPEIMKKFTVRHLDAVGVSKAHPELKELFAKAITLHCRTR
ncbi:uncharacterized protein BJ212DRAFT_1299630 [Suillus subaureus]|uniref:Uncharacterized protein n=1 Tax=Suillus subaureus TaxID=48587 RepID=A0A9P7EB50_9AGAM|nr:uncharacterized protein BJ212DRAFT_1299630 [Suillus subaureus]KAG1816331.1 hypothetical protein BJ212DRAFT_1299630 [Suillus subaureus]